jgi:hypothetical protein
MMFADAALAAFRAAVVGLGWRPADFWAATPAELAAALSAVAGDPGDPAPVGRSELARLIGEDRDGR